MHIRHWFVCCLLVASLGACSRPALSDQTAESGADDLSLAKIIVKNELTVGVNPAVPPLSFYAGTGKLIGYEVDIAQSIADRLGVGLRLVSVTVSEQVEMLKSGKIDYIASGFVNNREHAEDFALSQPYLRDALVVVVAENGDRETPFRQFADLRNKRIGVVDDAEIVDSVISSPLYDRSSREPYLYTGLEKLLIALDYGQIEAAVMNLMTYYRKITKEKKTYRIVGEPLVSNTYSYAFRKEDLRLKEAADQILTEMAYDGSLRTLTVKWFGTDVSMIGKY